MKIAVKVGIASHLPPGRSKFFKTAEQRRKKNAAARGFFGFTCLGKVVARERGGMDGIGREGDRRVFFVVHTKMRMRMKTV